MQNRSPKKIRLSARVVDEKAIPKCVVSSVAGHSQHDPKMRDSSGLAITLDPKP